METVSQAPETPTKRDDYVRDCGLPNGKDALAKLAKTMPDASANLRSQLLKSYWECVLRRVGEENRRLVALIMYQACKPTSWLETGTLGSGVMLGCPGIVATLLKPSLGQASLHMRGRTTLPWAIVL